MIPNTQKRTPATTAQYLATFARIRRRIAKLDGVQNEKAVAPERVVRYLIDGRPTWAKRTWIFYKRAVMVSLQSSQWMHMVFGAQRVNAAIQSLALEHQSNAKSRGMATSALKAKSFSHEDQRRLIEHLKQRLQAGDSNAGELFFFIYASLAVGLRPGEWANTALLMEGGKTVALQVVNAKATAGRGNGPTRTLVLTGLSEFQVAAVQKMVELARRVTQDPGSYPAWQNRLRHYLRRRAKAALGSRKKYPSLYTCRHQFAADAKSTLPPEEVAALMGHGSSATSGRSYARAKQSNGKIGVRPVSEEVRTVRSPENTRHPSSRERSTISEARRCSTTTNSKP